MGVTGFYQWLQKKKYVPKEIKILETDSLLVDTKLLIHKIAYNVDSSTNDLAQAIFDQIKEYFHIYKSVTFVNDGNITTSILKMKTRAKRAESKKKREEKAIYQENLLTDFVKKRKLMDEDETISFHNDALENQIRSSIEKCKRQKRDITTDLTVDILVKLKEYGYKTLQCSGEADGSLVKLASQYNYVISEDSDLLICGVNNMVRFFGTQNLLYYNVCEFLNRTPSQLISIAALSGCDYTDGLFKVGPVKAEKLILKFKTLDEFLKSKEFFSLLKPEQDATFVTTEILGTVALFESYLK